MDRSDALTGSITISGSTKSVYLGAIKFKEGSDFLTTYCVDPLNALNGSNNPYNKSILNTGDGTGLGLAGKILAANFTSALRGYEGAIYRIEAESKRTLHFIDPLPLSRTRLRHIMHLIQNLSNLRLFNLRIGVLFPNH